MGLCFKERVPSPETIKRLYPLSEKSLQLKSERDNEIRKVFTGESNKFIMVIGPCSADNEEAVCEYTYRLAEVASKVKEKIIIIPRVYTNKPRTNGLGYKGMFHQPNPMGVPDIIEGLYAIRKLHIRVIEETGLTPADEVLYTENWMYMNDLLSYAAIGARSVEDQQHRMIASCMDIPVGMKNPTSGYISVMLNACLAGQMKHTFLLSGYEVTSEGNELTHCILRGSIDKYGRSIANYHYEDLQRLVESYREFNLKNPACIVDANHNNSGKRWEMQPHIVKEVLHSRRMSQDIHKLVKGVMVESYIEDGAQRIDEGCYGKSITDPCLGWEKTKRLIYEVAELL